MRGRWADDGGLGRRAFCRTLALGLAGGAVALRSADAAAGSGAEGTFTAAGRFPPHRANNARSHPIAADRAGGPGWGPRLKIGCTGLIWGATPKTPENLARAVEDMYGLGFHGFETWGSVLQANDEKGTLKPLLEKCPIPYRSSFMGVNVHDPSKLKESIDQVIAWGTVTRKYGGTFAVVNAGGVDRKAFDFKAAKAHIVSGLNEHGKALQDIGLAAGLHQHTGSAVDARDEVYAVMEAVDTRYMKFAPDVGQLQKAGADAAQVIKDFLPIVAHMHLKDYSGGEHFAGYCPLGQGKVDLVQILRMMDEAHPDADVMVELDGSKGQPYTPRQTAEISKAFLMKQGYTFRA